MIINKQMHECEAGSSGRSVTLMITHKCNLRCSYCYERHDSDKEMSVDLAKRIILDEFEYVKKSSKISELIFDFIGGEPLLNFNCIKNVSEWIFQKEYNVNYMLYATTNGTLLNENMKQWFTDNREKFYLGLSLDGECSSHEINRKGSYNKIDINFFKNTWPDQHVKMTLSKETVGSLFQNIKFLIENGMKVQFNPAYGVDWNDDDADKYERELEKLSDYLLDKNIDPPDVLNIDFSRICNSSNNIEKFCGTGTNMITYDVDGRSYPCHMFTPIVIGDGRYDEISKIDFNDENNLVDKDCISCPIVKLCPTCYGFNYRYRGYVNKRDKFFCIMVKRQIKTAFSYQYKKILSSCSDINKKNVKNIKIITRTYDIINSYLGI